MEDNQHGEQFDLNFDDITIDFSNITIAGSTSLNDIISLDNNFDYSNMSGTYSMSPPALHGVYIQSGTSAPPLYSTSLGISGLDDQTVNISDNGIDIKEGADIRIGGKSLTSLMEKLEERFAILQPDPNKLENFEALKQAYEHYKLLESLCNGQIPEDPNNR